MMTPSSTPQGAGGLGGPSEDLERSRVAWLRELAARYESEAERFAAEAAEARARATDIQNGAGEFARHGASRNARSLDLEIQARCLEADAVWARVGATGARDLAEELLRAATSPNLPDPVDPEGAKPTDDRGPATAA